MRPTDHIAGPYQFHRKTTQEKKNADDHTYDRTGRTNWPHQFLRKNIVQRLFARMTTRTTELVVTRDHTKTEAKVRSFYYLRRRTVVRFADRTDWSYQIEETLIHAIQNLTSTGTTERSYRSTVPVALCLKMLGCTGQTPLELQLFFLSLHSQTLAPWIFDSWPFLLIQLSKSSHRYVSPPIPNLFSRIHGWISHITLLDELYYSWDSCWFWTLGFKGFMWNRSLTI